MDHNDFERQTRHFPATIKINWTNPAWYMRDVLCKLFSLSHNLFRRFYKLEPKLVNVTNKNRKLFKWTEKFYILMGILSFKCLLDSWKVKIGVALGISPLIWKKIKQLVVCSKHQNTWEDTGNVVKVLFSIQSKKKNARQWKETEFSTPFVVKAATSLLLNSLKFTWSHEQIKPWRNLTVLKF